MEITSTCLHYAMETSTKARQEVLSELFLRKVKKLRLVGEAKESHGIMKTIPW